MQNFILQNHQSHKALSVYFSVQEILAYLDSFDMASIQAYPNSSFFYQMPEEALQGRDRCDPGDSLLEGKLYS